MLFIFASVRAYLFCNLAQKPIQLSVRCDFVQETTVQPFQYFDSQCPSVLNATWTLDQQTSFRRFSSSDLPAFTLFTAPMIAAKGGTVIKGKAKERISEGSTIVLGRRLYRVTTVYDTYNDLGYSQLHFQWSDDNGMTFTEINQSSRVIIPTIQDEKIAKKVSIPSLALLSDGSVLLGYLQSVGYNNFYQIVKSTDNCKTWSQPMNITTEVTFHDPAHDRMVQLKSGRVIVPINREASPGAFGTCYVIYSDDFGKSWKKSDQIQFNTTCQEPAVQELDGVLIMIGRSYNGHAMAAYSTSNGENWSNGTFTNFFTPFASVQLKKFNNTLFTIYNRGGARKDLTVARLDIVQAPYNNFTEVFTFTTDLMMQTYKSVQYGTMVATVDNRWIMLNYWGTKATAQDDLYQLIEPSILFARNKQLSAEK